MSTQLDIRSLDLSPFDHYTKHEKQHAAIRWPVRFVNKLALRAHLILSSSSTKNTDIVHGLPTPISPLTNPAHYWPKIPKDTTNVSSLPTLQHNEFPLMDLPNECIDTIISFLPLTKLPDIMLLNKKGHSLAERRLYHKIQQIQLFSGGDGHCGNHWNCLRTLHSRKSSAQAVRHFTVKGLPWVEPGGILLLAQVISSLTNLCSLDIDLSNGPERDIFCSLTALSSNLSALKVADAQSAIFVSANGGCPIEVLRIDSMMDTPTANQLIPVLGQSSTPLRQLHIRVDCGTSAEAVTTVSHLVQHLPHLAILAIEFRLSGLLNEPRYLVSSHLISSSLKLNYHSQALVEGIAAALSPLTSLEVLSLTLPSSARGSKAEASFVGNACRRLQRLELQWSAWTFSVREQEWVVDQTRPSYSLMRRLWTYEHAKH